MSWIYQLHNKVYLPYKRLCLKFKHHIRKVNEVEKVQKFRFQNVIGAPRS